MKTNHKIYNPTSILLILSLLIIFNSCQDEPEVEPSDNNKVQNEEEKEEEEQNNSGKTFSPDELSSFLVFTDSVSKTDGELPSAPDGQIKIDVEDTIFVVKNYPIGKRIHFKHNPSQKISGFYIYVGGSSFYYDVPETVTDDQYIPEGDEDTTSVILIDIDPPADETDYPFTTEIVIQPHGESGTPLDEFIKWITVEDPGNNSGGLCNSITDSKSTNDAGKPVKTWVWDFTIREYNGEVLNVFAPGLSTVINSQGSGCCSSSGISFTVNGSPYCFVDTPHMTWVTLDVNDYSVRTYELLTFWDDGEIYQHSNEVKKQYDISITNFCSGTVGYTFDNNYYSNIGTHDFTPGASHINLEFPQWKGSWRTQGGQLIYTCNTLIMSWGGNDKFTAIYRKKEVDEDLFGFYNQWKPWFD